MSSSEAAVRAAFAQQAVWCADLGSPLTAAVMRLCAERLDRSSAVGRRVLDWTTRADAKGDAVPLRLAGGLHDLARSGAIPGLAAAYPPHVLPDDKTLWAGIEAALHAPGDPLDPWLNSAPQTNEVARSAILMAGLMQVADTVRLPLALYELGSSAGLNLMLDRYSYRLGGVVAGDPASPLRLEPEWRGPPPRYGAVQVASRQGVDLNPIDARDEAARARMLAYVWPDQAARLARIRTALDMAAAAPPPITQGDAAAWIESVLPEAPQPGAARVVMHSIAFQYFPAETRARIVARLNAAGGQATAEAPLAWLRFEVDPTVGDRPALRLTLWPGGADRLLAIGSAHGHWVEWGGETLLAQ